MERVHPSNDGGKVMKNILLPSLLIAVTAFADVAVTVYNNNIALVRQVRELDFERGAQEFRYTDVASEIIPTSVHFKSQDDPGALQILEQNYSYDLVNTGRLLEKYVDQVLSVTTEEGETFTGTLMSAGGDAILQTPEAGIVAVKSSAIHTISFPELPDGLITRPTLVWLLNAQRGGGQETDLSYLTRGMQWHAEYVAVVNENDTELELSGWVSIDNQSGATFKDAKVKLVAGDVNMAAPEGRGMARRDAMVMAAEAPKQFEEKAFFEYHLYTLQRPSTLQNRQIKQISLFEPKTASVDKKYVYDGRRDAENVSVDLVFINSEKNGLGMPLPKGVLRVYKSDEDGSQEFIGEDRIDHTSKDEKVRVTMGNAFDIVGERTVTSSQRLSKTSRRETIEIELRNHKDEAVTVTVIEHFYGDWQLLNEVPELSDKDAGKAEFEIKVPANESKTLTLQALLNF